MHFIRNVMSWMKKPAIWVGVFVLLFSFDVHAQASDTLRGFATILTLFVNIFTFIALKLIEFGGVLLGNEFITGPQAMAGLLPMYLLIRNMVNVSAVLFLVVLSFSNLFSGVFGMGNWTIKDKLPRLILALVLINFSLPIMRLALTVTEVLTVSIVGFADTSIQGLGGTSAEAILEQRLDSSNSPCYIESSTCVSFADKLNQHFCANESTSRCWFKIVPENADRYSTSSSQANNLFLAFGVYFQQLQQLPMLSAELDGFTGWTEVAQDVLFSVIMGIMYVVSLVALFIALLGRIVVMWVAIVASPLLIALSLLGVSEPGGQDIGGKIMTNLILPVKVALALSVSFVMMAGMADTMVTTTEGSFIQVGTGVFSLGTYGFIWQILTVVVFWGAAKWATQGSIAESIINTIYSSVEAAGSLATDALLIDRPIFSMKDPRDPNKNVELSLGALKELPGRAASSYVNTRETEKRKNLDALIGATPENKALQNTRTKIREYNHSPEKLGAKSLTNMTLNVAQTMGTDLAKQEAGKAELEKLYKHMEKNGTSASSTMQQAYKTYILDAPTPQFKAFFDAAVSNGMNEFQGAEKTITSSGGSATGINDPKATNKAAFSGRRAGTVDSNGSFTFTINGNDITMQPDRPEAVEQFITQQFPRPDQVNEKASVISWLQSDSGRGALAVYFNATLNQVSVNGATGAVTIDRS